MSNDEGRRNGRMSNIPRPHAAFATSGFVIVSSFVIRASSFLISFSAQRGDGICLGRAKRREQHREQTDDGKNKHDATENQWVVGGGAEKQRFHQTRHARGGEESDDETKCR